MTAEVRDLTASRIPNSHRNRWRNQAVELYRAAYHAWWLERETVCLGYATEMAEWMETHPAPRLADFLSELSGTAVF